MSTAAHGITAIVLQLAPMNLHGISKWFSLGLFFTGLMSPCFALDPQPRLWSHLPMGTNFVGVGYAYTEADIFVDPVILLEDVKMESQTWVGKYIRSFELFDKSARIDVTQAYREAQWTGLLDGVPASTSRSGWADTLLRLALNLYGAPPLSGKAYAAYRAKAAIETIVGMGLVVRLPTGEYMGDTSINIGQNRFAFRPQLGVIHKRGKWSAEVTGEAAFYMDNDEFFNGNTLEQEPLYFVHGHLNYSFRPGLWAGVSLGYDYGGETTVNGIAKDDQQQNIAWALSLAYPLSPQAGIKLVYVGARTQESVGLDSDALVASLSFLW
ncbi:MAG: transporter [Gammaproteobacteria bacterium]|nr:transporter [Gammaproteobacteria bacterium]